jgi:hypothetical protein
MVNSESRSPVKLELLGANHKKGRGNLLIAPTFVCDSI